MATTDRSDTTKAPTSTAVNAASDGGAPATGAKQHVKAKAAALALFTLAIVLLGCGAFAFLSAPAEANKTTAAVIPAFSALVMVLLGVWVSKGAASDAARTRVLTAGGIALVFALLFAVPTMGRIGAMRNYPAAQQEWSEQLAAGKVQDTNEVKRAFFRERKAAWYDQSFLVRTLGLMLGATGALGIWLLVSGLRMPK
jgi:hypothetical protein